MFFRFCKLCSNSTETSFSQLQRHYVHKTGANRAVEKIKPVASEFEPKKNNRVPIIECKRSEFNFYLGQTYGKREEIPLASKSWHHRKSKGDHFTVHPVFKKEEDNRQTAGITSFKDFHLHPGLLKKLEELEITDPTYIQKLGIPLIMNRVNSVLAAETGCGKTLAYALPLVHRVLQWKEMVERDFNCPLALVVTPTRELAVQIGIVLKRLSNDLGVKTEIIVGGKTKRMMLNPPVKDVDIVVASFGVISKLSSTNIYKLHCVRFTVLDEADALFHETFTDKLNVFMRRIPVGFEQHANEREFPQTSQLILASATMPSRINQALHGVVNKDSLYTISTDNLHRILIPQKFMRVGKSEKMTSLLKIVKPSALAKRPIIIFSNRNVTSHWVYSFLNDNNIRTEHLNGTMSVEDRKGRYADFRSGKTWVLSATNAGSRGLDTTMVNSILNYEFPLDTADYIHRSGRAGRKGRKGEARVINFISTLPEVSTVQKIERAIRRMRPIPIIRTAPDESDDEDQSFDTEFDPDSFEMDDEDDDYSIPY